MSRVCFVPMCDSGSKKFRKRRKLNLEESKISLFRVPDNEELRNKWEKLCHRADRRMCEKDSVCSKHFTPDDILSDWKTVLPNGEIAIVKRGRCDLKPDAVPSIFPGHPSYFNVKKKVRKAPKVRLPLPVANAKEKERKYPAASLTLPKTNSKKEIHKNKPTVCLTLPESKIKEKRTKSTVPLTLPVARSPSPLARSPSPLASSTKSASPPPEDFLQTTSILNTTFWNPLDEARKTILPSPMWGIHIFHKDNAVAFTWINVHCSSMKTVRFSGNMTPQLFINLRERKTTISPPETIEGVSNYLQAIEELVVCAGVNDNKYSEDCAGILLNQKKGKCPPCSNQKRREIRRSEALRNRILKRQLTDTVAKKISKVQVISPESVNNCNDTGTTSLVKQNISISDLLISRRNSLMACLEAAKKKDQ